jgi:Holliday junction resolvase
MGATSRRKGKVGEREWRDQLRTAGYSSARRGQQFSGSNESPDVVCEELKHLHFEVKRVEAGTNKVYDWIEQAQGDAGAAKLPIVAHRQNGREWLVIMPASAFFKLVGVVDSPTSDDNQKDTQCQQ